jgi:uncharacterized membrane protein YidH (DUF202 family)
VPHLEYKLAYAIRGSRMWPHSRPGRADAKAGCAALGAGQLQDAKSTFDAAGYAFVAWFGTTCALLAAWIALITTVRYGFGLDAIRSTTVQVSSRCVFGLAIAAMAISGLIIVKTPGRYVIHGRVSYEPRRFGPHSTDFWLGAAIGALAGLTL